MSIKITQIDADNIEINANGHRTVNLDFEVEDCSELLREIPMEEIIEHVDTEDLLTEIGIDTILENVNIGDLLDKIGISAVKEHFQISNDE